MNTPSNPSHETFEVVRRGYEPAQVDRHVASLRHEIESHRHRADEAERQAAQLAATPRSESETGPSYAGLGARIEKILGLADEEARHLKATAAEDATQHRSLTETEAGRIREEAERFAQERRADAEAEAARIVSEAKRNADTLRDDSERAAKARREEAEALFEGNRAKAAKSAADFETTLASRRDQAEKDFTDKMGANEAQLGQVSARAEQLRLEAEKLRADSDRKSKRTMDEANRAADDLLAEAKATAERIRTESERELSAATQRRDSINSQLTNVRQMLATLTGTSLPDPIGDTAGVAPVETKAADKTAAPSADKAVDKTAEKAPTDAAPAGNVTKAAEDAGGDRTVELPEGAAAAGDTKAATQGAQGSQGAQGAQTVLPGTNAPAKR